MLYSYSRARTLLDDDGQIEEITDAAVDHALAQAKQRPKRRECSALRTAVRGIAAFQEAAKAESCFVLSTTAPTVRAIAYAVVHTIAGVTARTPSWTMLVHRGRPASVTPVW